MSEEKWISVDWTGIIRVYPINEEHVDDLDDYDERRRGESQWLKAME